MHQFRVGILSYLNSLPFHLYLEKQAYALSFGTPAQLNSDFREKALDVALISATEFLDGNYHHLALGIAASHDILSVNLYIRDPLHDLNQIVVGVTSQSSTSVALLKVICHHFWKMQPLFEVIDKPIESYEAFLLIGDDALKQQHIPGYRRIDLAKVWRDETHLPFIFALFSSHQTEDTLHASLEHSLSQCAQNPEHLIQVAQKISGLPLLLLAKYYSLFSYRLGDKQFEGLKLFSTLRASCTEELNLKV